MKKLVSLSGLLAGAGAAVSLSAAPIVHVAPTGNDTNDGSESSPFASIAKAIDEVDAGGLIVVQSGDYVIIGAGGASGPPGLAINKPLTLRGSDPDNLPVVEFQNLPGTGANLQVGVSIAASNVTIENIEFQVEVHPTNDSVNISIPSGSAPTYSIIHNHVTLDNVTLNGARRGIFSHAGNLRVENSTFINQIRPNIQIRTMSCALVIRGNQFLGIPSFNDRQAIIFEGFGDLPPVSGTILIEGNLIVNKNQAVLFNQWNNGGSLIDFVFRHNTVQSLDNRGVIFAPGTVQDPAAFERFRRIEVTDNIFNAATRAVYVDYSDFGIGGMDPELKPFPANGQIVFGNNRIAGMGSVAGTETATAGNWASYRSDAQTPTGARLNMFLDVNNISVAPDYQNPGDVGSGDASLQAGSSFIGAGTHGGTIGAWQMISNADVVHATDLGEALLAVNTGGTVHLPTGLAGDRGAFLTRPVTIIGGGSSLISGNVETLPTAAGTSVSGVSIQATDSTRPALNLHGRDCGAVYTLTSMSFLGGSHGVRIDGAGDATIHRSTFLGSGVADIQTSDAIGAVEVTGNLFFGANVFQAVDGSDPSGNKPAFAGNWYVDEYDADASANGFIDGMEKVVSIDGSAQEVSDAMVVARLDRSANGLADAVGLHLGMSLAQIAAFDSDADGVPDGPGAVLGLDATQYAAVIGVDSNGNRIADWYEQSLGVYTPSGEVASSSPGRVGRGVFVGLVDAILALRIVNGSAPADHSLYDLNALNVTGTGPAALANPLQILRYQATVRALFPATPGVD